MDAATLAMFARVGAQRALALHFDWTLELGHFFFIANFAISVAQFLGQTTIINTKCDLST
jgi:hypothetical protein